MGSPSDRTGAGWVSGTGLSPPVGCTQNLFRVFNAGEGCEAESSGLAVSYLWSHTWGQNPGVLTCGLHPESAHPWSDEQLLVSCVPDSGGLCSEQENL